jgi:predicted enzyme related to lactoylglutathione lyase
VHSEIGCRDKTRTEEFFSKLFDWQIQRSGPTSMINTGGDRGINGHITALGHEPGNTIGLWTPKL